jgi:hypothetical protein
MDEDFIGAATMIDDGVVQYDRTVEGPDFIGDDRRIVPLYKFLEMGLRLDGELEKVGDTARILR